MRVSHAQPLRMLIGPLTPESMFKHRKCYNKNDTIVMNLLWKFNRFPFLVIILPFVLLFSVENHAISTWRKLVPSLTERQQGRRDDPNSQRRRFIYERER